MIGDPSSPDPYLMGALSRDTPGQLALLEAMCGDSSPPAPLRAARDTVFTPYGGKATNTPKGALSWLPARLPITEGALGSVVSGFDDMELLVTVDYSAIAQRQMPRHPKTVRALQLAIERALPYRGVHKVGIGCPARAWTEAQLYGACRLLMDLMPPTCTPEAEQAITLSTFPRLRPDGDPYVIIAKRDGFEVECGFPHVNTGMPPVIREWFRRWFFHDIDLMCEGQAGVV